MNIKTTIKNRRKLLGKTQLDIAKAVGVSEATVSRWESGDIADMGASKITALSKILGLSPAVIMGLEEPEHTINNYPALLDNDPLLNELFECYISLNEPGRAALVAAARGMAAAQVETLPFAAKGGKNEPPAQASRADIKKARELLKETEEAARLENKAL